MKPAHHRFMVVVCGAVIWLSAAGSPAQEGDDAALREFGQAYQRKDWPQALEFGLELARRDPKNSSYAYNLACVYALSGEVENALKWVAKSVDLGFTDVYLLKTDPDLETVQKRPEFADAIEVAKRNQAWAMEAFQALAGKSAPLIVAPPDLAPDKPAPVIIALHAYGGTAEPFADLWREAAKASGAILVVPRAVQRAGQGFQWGTSDEAEYLVTRAREEVAKKHKIDEKRVVLVGFSQGGYIAFSLALRYPQRFCGVIPVGGQYNPSLGPSSASQPTGATSQPAGAASQPVRWPRFFIMVGADDPLVDSNRRAAEDLRAVGAAVELKVYPGVGHDFPANRDEELRKALKFVLPS